MRRAWLKSCILAFMTVVVASGQGVPKWMTYPAFYTGPRSKAVVDGPVHDGVEIQIDLPTEKHVKNFAMPPGPQGLGLCVFASMNMQAFWHNVPELFDVIHKLKVGGGTPQKVDEVLKQFAPKLKYVQYEGTDPTFLDKALSEGRSVCVTYGYSERYVQGGQLETIYHMVLLVHLDSQWAVILDNNFPGTFEWMPRDEFLRRAVHPQGAYWGYVFLSPPPPPVPHN